MDVGVIGGTGAEGFGLALRLARAGHAVTIGSRDAARGAEAAERASGAAGAAVRGDENAAAAAGAAVVVVSVPFAGMVEIYRSIAPSLRPGQVVLDCTSPLMTAVGGRAWETIRPWHGSAAELAASLVPEGVPVVAGLHTVAAHALQAIDEPMDSDTFLCADDDEAKAKVGELLEGIEGLRWVDAGPLASARIAEPLTALLIQVNRRHKVKDSGFRVTGLGR
jgi:NADPH-dependent F420 reductase